ncbi:hypothetical protein CVD19_20150 [Bacillus sp. T33-2]|nr:hypothetical protein CVD19_20150 [Bacillus sp. T33-2]
MPLIFISQPTTKEPRQPRFLSFVHRISVVGSPLLQGWEENDFKQGRGLVNPSAYLFDLSLPTN